MHAKPISSSKIANFSTHGGPIGSRVHHSSSRVRIPLQVRALRGLPGCAERGTSNQELERWTFDPERWNGERYLAPTTSKAPLAGRLSVYLMVGWPSTMSMIL